MAFDGITTRIIVNELNNFILNSRVEKIYVPTRNEIWIYLHTASRKSVKLLISIDANNCRFHLSNESRNNPEKAPQFCMVLRKYLIGSKLLSISQIGLDRIIKFTFETINDFGDIVSKDLIVELMGKYSNIILLDDMKIIDSIRHVDITMSSVREVLPSRKYVYPSSLGKANFEETSLEDFQKIMMNAIDQSEYESISIANIVSNSFTGFSKNFIISICEYLGIAPELSKSNFTAEILQKIYQEISFVLSAIPQNITTFSLTENKKDYTIHIAQIHDMVSHAKKSNPNEEVTISPKNSHFLDTFYSEKENISLVKAAKQNIEHEINSHLNKLKKKLALVLQTLEDEVKLEKYRQYGEIISSNIYQMHLGMDKLVTENFYDNNVIVEIPLQVNLSPSRNAGQYFKKYNKLKGSISHAKIYQKNYESEIEYLTSVLFELQEAATLFEVDEIHEELEKAGYMKKPNKKGKKQDEVSVPLEYEYQGTKILVGRNNIQNDRLTLKTAKKNYTWLHTKNIHGSHVIIEKENVDDALLYFAATLAKKHSQAKNSSKVEVNYTLVKYVHKESGAKPGMVVYTDYQTIIVE